MSDKSIPKIIHYCWFGGKPLPESARKCIASWHKFLPDYEIKEWNESNYDVHKIRYTDEAYAAGKYAFVSDYARFDILYHEGGLYFDTDVEIIKPLDDIIARGPFMGRETGSYLEKILSSSSAGWAVNPGLGIGAPAGLQIYKELLDNYDKLSFIKADGSLNDKTIVRYTSEILVRHGLNGNNTESQRVGDIWIYPADVFCPMDHTKGNKLTITPRTVSIHHYDCSWINHNTVSFKLHLIKNWMMRHFGEEWIARIADFIKGR